MATNFIIQRSMERGGIFPKEDVATLCRLAGWSETSGSWALYVEDIFESHLDTSGLIYRCVIYFFDHIKVLQQNGTISSRRPQSLNKYMYCLLILLFSYITPFLLQLLTFTKNCFLQFISSNLRTAEERVKYLKGILSNFNFRLTEPLRNLSTEEDCKEIAPEEYGHFFSDFPVKSLKMSIAETQKGNKLADKLVYFLRKNPKSLTDCFWLSAYEKKTRDKVD